MASSAAQIERAESFSQPRSADNAIETHAARSKPFASISLDLDNKWSYLKTHGDASWETLPTYLPRVVPRILDVLQEVGLKITFFVVGQDADRLENHEVIRMIAAGGHEIGNHSYHHEPWLHLYTP